MFGSAKFLKKRKFTLLSSHIIEEDKSSNWSERSFELAYLYTIILRKAATRQNDESKDSTEEMHVSTKGQLLLIVSKRRILSQMVKKDKI